MPDAAANNQRVTMALLGQKMDHLTETNKDGFASVNHRLDKVEERLGASDVSDATSAEWRRQHEKEHGNERTIGGVGGLILAIAAALSGIFVQRP